MIGVMLDFFHSSGTVPFLSEWLYRAVRAGEIEVAAPRSMMLEILSGPEAVLVLWVDNSLRTSLWLQVAFDSTGLGGEGKLMSSRRLHLVKQEVKKLFRRFAFWVDVLALVPLWLRLAGVRVFRVELMEL
jgi:hypothetical protein